MENQTKGRKTMSNVSPDFKNGYNCCVEHILNNIAIIMDKKYEISVSPKEILLDLKEKILNMYFINQG